MLLKTLTMVEISGEIIITAILREVPVLIIIFVQHVMVMESAVHVEEKDGIYIMDLIMVVACVKEEDNVTDVMEKGGYDRYEERERLFVNTTIVH